MANGSDVPYDIDRRDIASRLRALLAPAIASDGLRTIAARLRVSPRALRASIEGDDPHPSSAVVLAVVLHHGVDPTWLLTGEYNGATHREALEDPASVARLLARTSLRDSLSDQSSLTGFANPDSSRIDDRGGRGD